MKFVKNERTWSQARFLSSGMESFYGNFTKQFTQWILTESQSREKKSARKTIPWTTFESGSNSFSKLTGRNQNRELSLFLPFKDRTTTLLFKTWNSRPGLRGSPLMHAGRIHDNAIHPKWACCLFRLPEAVPYGVSRKVIVCCLPLLVCGMLFATLGPVMLRATPYNLSA